VCIYTQNYGDYSTVVLSSLWQKNNHLPLLQKCPCWRVSRTQEMDVEVV